MKIRPEQFCDEISAENSERRNHLIVGDRTDPQEEI
jgi:hypothetical protein